MEMIPRAGVSAMYVGGSDASTPAKVFRRAGVLWRRRPAGGFASFWSQRKPPAGRRRHNSLAQLFLDHGQPRKSQIHGALEFCDVDDLSGVIPEMLSHMEGCI